MIFRPADLFGWREFLFQVGLRRGVRNGAVLVWLCCLIEGIIMLAAGGRLVTGLDHPIDKAHRPGALKEMLRQMKSGEA